MDVNKVLVIPDVHGRNFWRKAIDENANKVSKVVFLGDYFDPYSYEYDDNPESMEKVDDELGLLPELTDIVKLKENEPDKYILLLGNHDLHYLWKNFTRSSRFDKWNCNIYHEFFSEFQDVFQLVYTKGDIIFSHAGISFEWAKKFLKYMKYTDEALVNLVNSDVIEECANVLEDTPIEKMNSSYIDALSLISAHRGGFSRAGSCIWADVREHISDVENGKIIGNKTPGIFQVFGHTQLNDKDVVTDYWACIDNRKAHIVDVYTREITIV